MRRGKRIKSKVPRGSNSLIDNLGIVSQGNRLKEGLMDEEVPRTD
ncbi:hypothetical protein KC19_9G036100 [Ceratodon purpureus]|uniref:Uncharacterized protein n=1 Tax=Ceratodon purpureus TaxID=3225 RepID=A0A8T0GPZ2_CERPU|nr:hypothetical protein KC19_9G036100 [Ceratodon purpureus]